jgi:hypothetical protein
LLMPARGFRLSWQTESQLLRARQWSHSGDMSTRREIQRMMPPEASELMNWLPTVDGLMGLNSWKRTKTNGQQDQTLSQMMTVWKFAEIHKSMHHACQFRIGQT